LTLIYLFTPSRIISRTEKYFQQHKNGKKTFFVFLFVHNNLILSSQGCLHVCGGNLSPLMPFALALLSIEKGGQPLLVVPTEGIALGSATAALKEFAALADFDAAWRGDEELCLPVGAVIVHYKVLPGDAVMATVLCEPWENPYAGKEALADLEMVALTPPVRRARPP